MSDQLSFWGKGEARKEAGIASVEANNPTFCERMRKRAIEIASEKGTVTSDDLRLYGKAMGIVPNHPNAWGAIFRGKLWTAVGHEKSKLNSNHSREIRVWAIRKEDS